MELIGLKLYSDDGRVYIKGESVNGGKKFYKDEGAFLKGDGICYISSDAMEAVDVIYRTVNKFIPESVIIDAGLGYDRKTFYEKFVADSERNECDNQEGSLYEHVIRLSNEGRTRFSSLYGETY